MLHFFLSYAHGERDDSQRVRQFFDDLSTEVRVLTGDDGDTVVGFHDDGVLRLGDDWPRELVEALCRAQTMLALFSPRYFRSEFCGKEWTLFSERIRRWENQGGARCARVIPVFWVHTIVPEAIGHLHYRDSSLGEAYQRDALRELMREGGREYPRFVRKLAQCVVGITGTGEPMADSQLRAGLRADLRAVPSAFHQPGGIPASPVAGTGPAPTDRPGRVPAPRRNPDTVDDSPPPRPILSLEVTDGPERLAPQPGRPADGCDLPMTSWPGGGHEHP